MDGDAFDVPANTLLFRAFLLACPLMTMDGMHGGRKPGAAEHRAQAPEDHDQDPIVRR
jgi:hypothetical protein